MLPTQLAKEKERHDDLLQSVKESIEQIKWPSHACSCSFREHTVLYMEAGNKMGFIKLDFTVAAPVEHVWSFGLQAEKIPEWQFDVVAVKGISGPIDRKGIKYSLVYKKAGILLNSPVEVSRFEPENLTVETTGKTPLGGYFKSCTTMRRIDEQMTHVDWVMDYKLPGWILGVLMDRLLFEWAFRKTVQIYNRNFKMLAENTH